MDKLLSGRPNFQRKKKKKVWVGLESGLRVGLRSLYIYIYAVVFLGWHRYSRFFQARVVRRMHHYGPGTS